jgi:L-asparaginase
LLSVAFVLIRVSALVAGAPGADGPANLPAAARIAVSEAAGGLGTLVVLNDDIHAARFVPTTRTTLPLDIRSRARSARAARCAGRRSTARRSGSKGSK